MCIVSHQHARPTEQLFLPRSALAAAPAPAYGFDWDGRLDWWNDTLATATGYTEADLADLRADDLFTACDGLFPDATAELSADWWELDVPLVTADGSELPCRHTVAPATRADGTVAGVVGVAGVREGADDEAGAPERGLLELLSTASSRLAAAAVHGDVARTVCEVVVDTPLYDAAWVGRQADGVVSPTVAVGTPLEMVEALLATWARADADSPVARALADDQPQVHASRDATHVVVPVPTRESTEGVLVVATARPVGAIERRALEGLAAVFGLAAAHARTERLVISEPAVELEFRLTDPSVPLVRLSREAGATGRLGWMRREPNGDVTQFFEFHDVEPETVVAALESSPDVVACRPVDGDTSLFETRFERSAIGELLAVGATVRDIATTEEGARLTAVAPADTDVRGVVDRLESLYPGVELVAKRGLDVPGDAADEVLSEATLTDRQREALATAFASGYFEWPRDATAEAVATELGVSAATFHYHLRRAERALVAAFLGASS